MRERNEALDCYVYARAAAAARTDRFEERHWRELERQLGVEQPPDEPPPIHDPTDPLAAQRGGLAGAPIRGASSEAVGRWLSMIFKGVSHESCRIESLVIRVAQEFNDVRATAGNLASLSTTDKSSLVAAINELKAAVLSATAIDDNQIATSTTYSSNKIVSLLDALKADILGWRGCRLRHLVEIQQLLQNGTSGLDALLAAINLRVRFDAAQTLTVAEQLQARTNIGAVAAADVGNTDTGLRRDLRRALA